MPNSPDPPFTEEEAQPASDHASRLDGKYEFSPATTIEELRRVFGPGFAPGYAGEDLMGELLERGNYNNLDEYLAHSHLHPPDFHKSDEG
jgi:hypothetical protein